IAVLYASFFSFTVTGTKASREPSCEIWVSPALTKLNKSFSVMFRFCARAGTVSKVIVINTSKRRVRIRFPFGTECQRGGILPGTGQTGNLKHEERGQSCISAGKASRSRAWRYWKKLSLAPGFSQVIISNNKMKSV